MDNTILSSKSTHCIWDKHPIRDWTSAVGCPMRYNPTEVIKKQVTKDSTFVIKDRIPSDEAYRYDFVHKPHKYECEGVFCSVECCKAYIVENRSKSDLYDNAVSLLMQMCGITNKIHPASHWRTIDVFGGDITIEEFRRRLGKVTTAYKGTHVISNACTKLTP